MVILPELGNLLLLENQFRMNENGRLMQISAMYYALHRPTALAITLPDQEEEFHPEFIAINSLQHHQLQFGYHAIQTGRLHA